MAGETRKASSCEWNVRSCKFNFFSVNYLSKLSPLSAFFETVRMYGHDSQSITPTNKFLLLTKPEATWACKVWFTDSKYAAKYKNG